MSAALALYRIGTALIEPFAPMVLEERARKGKEDRRRLNERLGHPTTPRPEGKLVWLHGVSVGETLSLLPLIERLRAERPDLNILVTSGTVTSAELLARRLPPGVIHQYVPVDGPGATARFMAHWRPNLGIMAESDLWPNLISAAHHFGAKLALVSARLTEGSAKGWAKRPAAFQTLLSRFDLILPQDQETAERLRALNVASGPLLNLKSVGEPLPCEEPELKRLKAAVKGRQVVVAASTHPGEDDIVASAVPAGPLLVIIPRHPDRGEAIAAALTDAGRRVARRSAGAAMTKDADVFIADTLGEMGLFLRLADLAVLGGSLVPDIGGHNPLEPARLGVATLSGPFVHKNAELFAAMEAANAVRLIPYADIAEETARLLADKAARMALAKAGLAFAEAQGAAFETGWAQIRALLP